MSEFEEKLNAFLSNPDAMAQVMNLAQSLNLGGGGESQEAAPGGEALVFYRALDPSRGGGGCAPGGAPGRVPPHAAPGRGEPVRAGGSAGGH